MYRLNKIRWTLVILNAILIGTISFISILISGSGNLDQVFISAFLGGVIKALIELQTEVKSEINRIKRGGGFNMYELLF